MKRADSIDTILWTTKGRKIQRGQAYLLRLFLVGLLVITLIIATFFFFYKQVNLLLEKQSSFYLQEITNKSAERLKEKVDGDIKMLQSFALLLGGLDGLDVEHWLAVMDDSPLFSEFQRYGFLLSNRRMYTSELQGLVFTDQKAFDAVMQGQTVITDVYPDQVYQKPIIVYGVPILQHQEVVAALGVAIVLKEYEQILDIPLFAGEGNLHLLDRSGATILSLGDADIPSSIEVNQLQDEFKAKKSGIIRLGDTENPRLFSYAPVGVHNWNLLLEIPPSFLRTTRGQTKRYAFGMTLLYGVLMLFFPLYILFIRRKNDLALLRLAYFDELTAIANATLFVESAEHLVRKHGARYACIILNIRRFKLINDLFGYSYGDALLKQLASMLPTFCAKDELYARKGADRFVLLLKQEGAEQRVHSLLTTMNHITLPDTARFTLEVVGGIFFLKKPLPINICIDRASLALDYVKSVHGKSYTVYNETIREQLLGEGELVKDFQEAIVTKQFVVLLQPKYSLVDESVIGAEALVRWNHPTRGFLSPIQFIPLFEENNLITELDMYVLREVCAQLQKWHKQGLPLLPVSVNQSRAHLPNPHYVQDLITVVDRCGLEHTLLEFELTENIFLENIDPLKTVIDSLRAEGFSVSIDDFGSGYSSLTMLKNIRFDVLKLDREFLMKAEDDHRSQVVILSVIQMAEKLGITIIAEGVETKEQADMLKAMGCPIAQGYYYQRPIAMDDFALLLQRTE